MMELAILFWNRSLETLQMARFLIDKDPTLSASRSYYAAFYACSGLLALKGKTFRRHKAIEKAIHEHFIHTGHWPEECGQQYAYLLEARATADYVMTEKISGEIAQKALIYAESIIHQVAKTEPDAFKLNV